MFRIIVLRLLESFFKRWVIWLIPILLMSVFGAVRFLTAEPSYISSSALFINKDSLLGSFSSIQEDGFAWVTPAEATVAEFKELMQTDAFLRSVIQVSDLEAQMGDGSQSVKDTLVEARNSIWVSTLGKNTILVAAAHKEPQIAQQLAAGTIQVYIQWKININREESSAALAFVDTLAATYQQNMQLAEDELRAFLDAHPAPVRGDRLASEVIEIERLQRELDTASSRYQQTLNDRENSQLSLAVADSQVRQTYLLLDAPRYPLEPSKSKTSVLVDTIVFVVVGAVISVFGIIGTAVFDSSVHFPVEIQHILELPVMAVIPSIEGEDADSEHPSDEEADDADAEHNLLLIETDSEEEAG